MPPIEPNTPPYSRAWRVIQYPPVTLAIGLVFYLGAAFAATWLSRGFPLTRGQPIELVLAALIAALFLTAYAAFVRRIERRAIVELGGRDWWRELGLGLLGGVALFSLVLGIIAAAGGYRVIGVNPPSVLYSAIALAIVSGVSEEIALRGLLFRILERWLGSWIALAISAGLFGALHLGNPNATPLAGAAIMLEAGIMLAALYMVTRRLWAAIGVHAAWNLAQGGIYGISVSGIPQVGLLRPVLSGPDWLTGGAFGVEASLPAVLICTAFGVALLALAVRRGRIVAPIWVRRRDVTV